MLLSLIGLLDTPATMLAVLIAFLSALCISMPFHEFAHAHAAYKEGDLTAKSLGRYTLAPFAHIDWWGLTLLLICGIGYAKPVPVDSRNFKRGKKSEIRVAFAGVLTNLLIGIVSCFIFSFLINIWPELFLSYGFISNLYYYFFQFAISLNFMFAFFNILPIYPLDGFRLVEAFSKPYNRYVRFMRIYGFWIMLALILTGILGIYIEFFAGGLANLLLQWFNSFFGLMV